MNDEAEQDDHFQPDALDDAPSARKPEHASIPKLRAGDRAGIETT